MGSVQARYGGYALTMLFIGHVLSISISIGSTLDVI